MNNPYHRTCSIRGKNGDYEFILDNELVYNPALCDYRQICENGKLKLSHCPLKYSWNNEQEECVPEEQNLGCKPSSHWSIQHGLDLSDCIGLLNGECRLGFASFTRAQKYCESHNACVGIKETPCNDSNGIGVSCFGARWRPYSQIVDTGDQNKQIWTLQQSNGNSDDNNEAVLANHWTKTEQARYEGCPDGFVTDDSDCKTNFESKYQAMVYCEGHPKCSGVAHEGDSFIPIETILSDEDAATRRERNGTVIEKLNRIIQAIDQRTADNMLTEYWEEPVDGELAGCTQIQNGECIPVFDNEFEAKYYCEGLGDKCAGISQDENGNFTTKSGTEIIENENIQSWLKANWCSDYTPSLNMKLPSIFNIGNNVKIMWPVVKFSDIINDMKRSSNDYLNVIASNSAMTHGQYQQYSLKLEINVDTLVFGGDITLYNVQEITIKARKVLVKKPSRIKLKQSAAQPDWTSSTAPKPNTGYDGNHGEHGVAGFNATAVIIDAGCVVGDKDSLVFDISSGDGSNGQHGSDGLKGKDGEDAKNTEYFVWNGKRENVCGTISSCESCCNKHDVGDWYVTGKDCSIKGTDGGNGGNGGNSGAPGSTGNITINYRRGYNQTIVFQSGEFGLPGIAGRGKSGGKKGHGGCGESTDCSTTGNGNLGKTSCRSFVECSGKYKGKDCASNSNGKHGKSGVNPSYDSIGGQTLILIDNKHMVDASDIFLDYLLKYAIVLANEQTINESQEILIFLSRYECQTGRTATKLLNRMGKHGQFDSFTRPISQKSYNDLSTKTDKIIQRGVRIENFLNKFGEMFEFKKFILEAADFIIEETNEYMQDLRLEEDELLDDLSKSFRALQHMEYKLNMTTIEMYDLIDLLTVRINQQITSIQVAAKQQAALSGLCAIAGLFMPWTWFSRSNMKAATESAVNGVIAYKLNDVECENLALLNFLTEFASTFSVLGTNVALLRTIEDFKNFERQSLKEFFQSSELKNMLESDDFYFSAACVLGLAEVPDVKPPKMGWINIPRSLDELINIPGSDFHKVTKWITAVTDLLEISKTCMQAITIDEQYGCFLSSCDDIMKALSTLFDADLKCPQYDLRFSKI